MKLKNSQILHKVIFILSFLSFSFFVYILFKNNIASSMYRNIAIAGLGLIYIIFAFVIFYKKISKFAKILVAILAFLLGLALAFASYYANKSIETIKELNENTKTEVVEFSYIVKKDSNIESLEDLKGKDIYTALERDKENVEKFVEKQENTYKFVDGGDYSSISSKLLANEVEVILLNESYRQIIEESIKNFSDSTRIVSKHDIEKVVEIKVETDKEGNPQEENKEKSQNYEGFNLYISGIDSYGSLSSFGRSDVNIILSINPKTKQILMTTIPRDSYVPIAGMGNNQKDKLTHAGIYGINTSIESLENLFGINIDYYAKTNFSSLIKIVDALDGVDVYSSQNFSAGGYSFQKGMNHLYGNSALAFARERKSLGDGDLDRGRNQLSIIEAILRKMMSPSILLRYDKILEVVTNSSQTDMPYDKMMELINGQISDGGEWEIKQMSLKGQGTTGLPSYAMPGWKLYMYEPYEDSINDISEKIKNTIR